ncbi:DUF421 domain-containing protein [Salinisphaera sp. Q1T1-3]|uniref:DUF421 domain-containing protein n=1 Tax=Salinisphaera sp. Q1T1-3 TaxID=2321229 RepID=UPI000E72EE72|nr:YetF domain-containing protein [Salinisphaera sp. Q1T1-3]RJS91165.1 DUF421 domain-containing protein [Salinisphaera sp. Q1T1-3]
MIDSDWFTAGLSGLVSMTVSAIVIYIALLLFTRLSGLRSFSKMSSFDFAITVAFGTILASTLLSRSPALLTGIVALGLLYLIQYGVARARRADAGFARLVDNEPLLLMAGSELLTDNLSTARLTEDDLNSKLRLAGLANREEVLAVTLESTGDVAVIKKGQTIDPQLFAQVRDGQRLID